MTKDKNMLEVLRTIAIEGVRFERAGLVFEEVSEATLEAAARYLQVVENCRSWWWGDWICAYCDYHLAKANGALLPEDAKRKIAEYTPTFVALSGCEVKTVWHWRQVANFYKPSRRREGLSWAHHMEAMYCDGGLAKAMGWLDKAESKGWSVRDLRRAIRAEESKGLEDNEPMPSVTMSELLSACRWSRGLLDRARSGDMSADEAGRWLEHMRPLLDLAESLRACAASNAAHVEKQGKESITTAPPRR